MFKFLRKLAGIQSLEDILSVFHKARADLERYIGERDTEIEHHEGMKAYHNISVLGLQDVKADAQKVHANLTSLLSVSADVPAISAANTASPETVA